MVIPELVDFSSVGASVGVYIGEVVCGILGVCVMVCIIRAGVAWVRRLIAGDGIANVEAEPIDWARAMDDAESDYDYEIDGKYYVNTRWEELLEQQRASDEADMQSLIGTGGRRFRSTGTDDW